MILSHEIGSLPIEVKSSVHAPWCFALIGLNVSCILIALIYHTWHSFRWKMVWFACILLEFFNKTRNWISPLSVLLKTNEFNQILNIYCSFMYQVLSLMIIPWVIPLSSNPLEATSIVPEWTIKANKIIYPSN